MAFREATPEEIAQLMGQSMQQQAEQATFRPASPEEIKQLEQGREQVVETPELDKEKPGLTKRIIQRVMGTDVDDPLQLERMGTTTLGAMGGAMAGSRVPPAGPMAWLVNPVTGAAAGGLVGAVSGAVAPEATLETMEFLGLLPEGARKERALSNEELRRVVEGEALIELLTLGTAGAIRAGGRGISKLATGTGRAEQQLAGEMAKQGIELAPFQIGERGLGKGVVNVLGRFPFIGSKAKSVGEAAEQGFKMIKEGAPSRIAPVLASNVVGERLWRDSQDLVKSVGKKFDEEYDKLFAWARRMGVEYDLKQGSEAAQGVLESIAERTPTKGKASEAAEIVRNFLTEEGYENLGRQSLGQADELIKKIDQKIANADEGIRGEVQRHLMPIRGAIKGDIDVNAVGETARQVADQIAKVDADFTNTMREFFETTAAQKFTTVQAGGLRSTLAPSQRATQIAPDQLANLFDLNSPQALQQLSRLTTKNTYKEFAAAKLSDIFGKSMTTGISGAAKLNAERMAKEFGVGATTSVEKGRQEAVKTMLKQSDSPLKYSDLETLVEAAAKISKSPIPNWSTFIARRATLGGAGSLIRGILPGISAAGATTAGGAAAGPIGGAIGGLMFMLGSKGLVGAVSNPDNARAFSTILSKEAKNINKRAAWLRLTRATASEMAELGEITVETANRVIEDSKEVADELFKEEQ